MLLHRPVVWVDPDLDYSFLMRRALLHAAIENPLVCLTSGELAISYLTKWSASDPVPLLIVIGAALPNMPRMQLLTRLKNWPKIASTPVVFLEREPEVGPEILRQLGVLGVLKKSSEKDKTIRLLTNVIANYLQFEESKK
jgi:CheY-like chemotaxis protein